MQTYKKTMAIVIATILVTSMALSIVSLPPTSAALRNGVNYDDKTTALIDAGMTWAGMPYNISSYPNRELLWNRFHDKIPTYSFLIAAPNPVGIGQMFNLIMLNPQVPPSALMNNDIRYTFTLKIVKPDGSVENLPPAGVTRGTVAEGGIMNGKYVSDSTGSTYAAYTPDQEGNYTITLFTDELFYRWSTPMTGNGDNNYYGTTFLASNYTLTVNVQQDPVSLVGLPNIQALPTEYWTRPIEGQNTGWYAVSSNWLSAAHDRDNGGAENRYQADGTAPNSPHILWTRPTEDNGLVGGSTGIRDEGQTGNAFNAGSQYQPRWTNQMIMHGRLYYSPNPLTSGSSSFLNCVDLKTGELIYQVNTGSDQTNVGGLGVSTTANMPQFGYYYSQDDPNQHGIQNPGWLFSSNYGIGYQPAMGFKWMNITNVASGFEVNVKPTGENVRYNFGGNMANGFYLTQWNSSKVIPMMGSTTNLPIPGNAPITPANPGGRNWNGSMWVTTAVRTAQGYYAVSNPAFDWNVTLATKFSTTPTIRAAIPDDILWGSNGSWPTGTSGPSYYYPNEVTIWAINLKPESRGQLIYMKNLDIDDEAKNTNEMFERVTPAEGVFVTLKVPMCSFVGYDMRTGNRLWETDEQSAWQAYGYFTWPSLISQTQTKMAYGMLFTGGYTGAVSAYSLTDGQLLWRHEFPSGGAKIPNFVQMLALICDGKIYVGTHEHSADTPLYKGERVHAFNVTTGEMIWDMSSWAYPMSFATADGVLVYWNNYDAQVYAIGKGPSSTTVTASPKVSALGSSVIIEGTVTDISAGTKQNEQAARFPNGVAAVSDEAQAQWMEYVYMQKGRPTNTTGVPVVLSVVDANGNYREIGMATTDDGFFSFNWKPDIEGKYSVYASFQGSESYWPSHAVAAFGVDPAAATPSPTQPPQSSMADTYLLPGIAAIIVVIVIIGAMIMLMLRKRP